MTLIRIFLLGIAILVATASAQASSLTLNVSGNVDLTTSGGAAINSFSGFFTWDPAALPFETEPDAKIYPLEAYQFILNGVDKTGAGCAVFVADDADPFGTGNVDALGFFVVLEQDAVIGDTLFIGVLSGPTDSWNTTSLPTDYSFLSLLPTRFSAMSLEVPNEGDANDIRLGTGSLAVSPVPEPASVTVTALGLATIIACARRSRQRP
jgi:hypothetical protein